MSDLDKLADTIRQIALQAARKKSGKPLPDFEWKDGPEHLKEGWRAVARWHLWATNLSDEDIERIANTYK
jgi:hypothetical protein